MASVDVVPDDHSSDEKFEKKGNEELKTTEQGGIPPSKENKVIDGEEKAKAEESVSVKAPTESGQEVANIQIVPSAIVYAEKVEKFDEVPDSDVPVTDDSQVGVCPDSKLDKSSIPESVAEAVEEKPEESSKVPDVNESSIGALEKPVEHLEVSPTKDPEPEMGKQTEEVSGVEPKMVEKPESVVELKRKPQEQYQEFEEKSQKLEPKESMDKDITVDGGTEADDSLEEEVSILEPKMVEKPESDVEAVGKPEETEESDEKSETLKLKESINNDSGKDGETKVDKSLKEEVPVVEPKTLEMSESVAEMGGKPQEQVEEVEKKYEILEPKHSVDKDTTIDGGTKGDDSLKEEVPGLEPKMIEKPESILEAVGKPQEAEEVEEKSEMLKPKESINNDNRKDGETNADKSLKEEVSVVEPKTLGKSESVFEMGGKPQEQAEEVEKKSEMLEPKENMDSDVTEEATPIDMVKNYTELLKEEEVTKDQDLVPSESDIVACVGREAESGLKEDGIRSVTPDVVENASVDNTEKEVGVDEEKAAVQVGDSEPKKQEKVVNIEESKDKDVKTEELTQPEGAETIEETEAKDMKIDGNEETNVKNEELMLLGPTVAKDVGGSCVAAEVEEQSASIDAEMVIEEKKEQDARADMPDLKGKVDVVDTNVVNEPTAESKESELKGKVEEAIQSCVDDVDKREVAEETAKSGASNVELSNIESNAKTDQVPPKQEVPAKPSQKQSNNIISKVKQSIVKVKKAILGKSPSSKTLSSEAKGDIQVK